MLCIFYYIRLPIPWTFINMLVYCLTSRGHQPYRHRIMVVFIQYACYYGFLNFKTNAFDLFSFGLNLFKHQSRRFPMDVQPRILYFYFKCRLGIWMNIHIIFTTTLILHSSTVTYWRFLIKLWSSMSAHEKSIKTNFYSTHNMNYYWNF